MYYRRAYQGNPLKPFYQMRNYIMIFFRLKIENYFCKSLKFLASYLHSTSINRFYLSTGRSHEIIFSCALWTDPKWLKKSKKYCFSLIDVTSDTALISSLALALNGCISRLHIHTCKQQRKKNNINMPMPDVSPTNFRNKIVQHPPPHISSLTAYICSSY